MYEATVQDPQNPFSGNAKPTLLSPCSSCTKIELKRNTESTAKMLQYKTFFAQLPRKIGKQNQEMQTNKLRRSNIRGQVAQNREIRDLSQSLISDQANHSFLFVQK
jgi:hypothetical protein